MKHHCEYSLFALVCLALPVFAQANPPQSGRDFQGKETRALEADEFANPGMLWVEQGAKLWREARGAAGKSCADCHGDAKQSMRGVAASYPKADANGIPPGRRVLSLDQRINACVESRQAARAFAWESRELLSLSAFISHQSKGLPIKVDITGSAAAAYARGKALYFQRIGQMNLACTHCHDQNWGKTLLAEPVSQGQPDGWPAYRLEWQTLGSLQRRLRACFFGVRAEQPAFGSDDLVALELYLAKRAEGLPIAAPGVRR
ncbi:MAG: sulfur oxidation c-type cytochrome SoxA [Betaproteobacteria bacterium]|nr:sulfur oxidation c-type cytochrome SoxA [Betaproteobacteria bacterium]